MLLFGFIVSVIVSGVVAFCYIVLFAFTIWMMVDAAKQDRFWWLVLVLGVPVVGPAVYYFTEKKHEYVKAEPHHIHESETEEQHEKAPKKKKARKSKAEAKKEGGFSIETITSDSKKEEKEMREENPKEENSEKEKISE